MKFWAGLAVAGYQRGLSSLPVSGMARTVNVGDYFLLCYDNGGLAPLWHELLCVGVSPTPGRVAVVTSDFDEYIEDIVVWRNPDVAGFIHTGQQGATPAGIPSHRICHFSAPVGGADLARFLVNGRDAIEAEGNRNPGDARDPVDGEGPVAGGPQPDDLPLDPWPRGVPVVDGGLSFEPFWPVEHGIWPTCSLGSEENEAAHEHETLPDLMGIAANLAWAEAHRGSGSAQFYTAADYFMGAGARPRVEGVAPALSSHVSECLRADATVQEEARAARADSLFAQNDDDDSHSSSQDSAAREAADDV